MRTLYGKTNANPVSRFIGEIPEELWNFKGRKEKPASHSQGVHLHLFKRRLKRHGDTKLDCQLAGDSIGWNVGDKAGHRKWGIGTVVSVKGEGDSTELDIAFPSPIGIKRLLAKFAPIEKV